MTDAPSRTAEDDGPDGMLAYALAIRNPSRDDPRWPLPSFDACDWAAAFVKIAKERPGMATDEDAMIGWFANALMRGYDEHAMRAASRCGDRLVMIDNQNRAAELPLVHNDLVERVAVAIEETSFAPHELPLTRELHSKYRDTAREAISAVRQWDAGK